MWQILGVLVFCGLLSPSVGTVPAIRSAISTAQFVQAFTDTVNKNDLLASHLSTLPFADITLGGLLGIVGKVLGLKVASVRNVEITLVTTPDKIKVKISCDVDITGNLILSLNGIVNIFAHVDINFSYGLGNFLDGKFDIANFQCVPTVGNVVVQLLGGVLPPLSISAIQQSITSDLAQQVCGIVKTVLDAVHNIWLSTGNVILPYGNVGNLRFKFAALPTITDTSVGIDLIIDFQVGLSGIFIGIPNTAASIAVPALDIYKVVIAIHPAVLNIVLSASIPTVPLELNNILSVFSQAEELKNALLPLIPVGVLPNLATSDLSFKITIGTSPLIAFDATGGIVTISAQIEILAKKPDGTKVSVAVLKCSISAKVIISVVGGKLYLGLLLSSTVIELTSSSIGVTDLGGLIDPITTLVNEAILPVLNGPLAQGIPLPALLGIPVVNVVVKTVVNALLICL